MPSLNFQARFAPLIESGAKRRTIRAWRKDKRDPKKGDPLYLYTGLRTKSAQSLRIADGVNVERVWARRVKNGLGMLVPGYVCKCATPVQITNGGVYAFLANAWASIFHLDTFARLDGFADWHEMRDWFDHAHGPSFDGVMIEW